MINANLGFGTINRITFAVTAMILTTQSFAKNAQVTTCVLNAFRDLELDMIRQTFNNKYAWPATIKIAQIVTNRQESV